jgi:hypothetical protein
MRQITVFNVISGTIWTHHQTLVSVAQISQTVWPVIHPLIVWSVSKDITRMELVDVHSALRTALTVLTVHTAVNATTPFTYQVVCVHYALWRGVYHATQQTTVSTVSSRCGKMPAAVPSAPLHVCSAQLRQQHAKAASSVTTWQGLPALLVFQ